MRILLDECLHTSLVEVAQRAGHACDHVNYLGLGGYKDWQLMARIRDAEYVFVTNNRLDFLRLYGREELHAGLIVILPSVAPALQRDLLQAALSHIGQRDLTNRVVEAQPAEAGAICREYAFPR